MFFVIQALFLVSIIALLISQVLIPILNDTETWWLFRKRSQVWKMEDAKRGLADAEMRKEVRQIEKESFRIEEESTKSLLE